MEPFSIPTTEVENESPNVHPNWLELPRDVTANILQRLGTIEILSSACKVCPSWWNICKDPYMWRTIRITRPIYPRYSFGDNLKIFCNAVERSCGQVEDIDIHIEGIETFDLLQYMLDNCACHLRRLWLLNLGRFTRIEEFMDYHNGLLSNDSPEVVGRSFPLLKSFEYIGTFSDDTGKDVCSFVIAEIMPGLLHLKISVNMVSDDGILAILDGCPLLQSFDLEGCYSCNLSESVMKRCREQIKVFVPPQEWYSADDDFDWSAYENFD